MMKLLSFCHTFFILPMSILPCQGRIPSNYAKIEAPTDGFLTSILLGNQYTTHAEIYQLVFECNSTMCQPLPLQESDLLWSSPDTPGISEVKFVKYMGQRAILATTQNGAIVYAFPNGSVLFHRELDSNKWINVHSAEVMPDGNVVVAGSVDEGIFAVLFRDDKNVTQAANETVSAHAPFGHGLVYDKARNRLYAAGYLTFLVIEYKSGKHKRGELKVTKTIPLSYLYEEKNKNEDANYEDGVHDLYPVDGSDDTLWLTTGERVFTINITDFNTTKFDNLFTIDSQHSQQKKVAVKNKGGVKGVSSDVQSGLVIAKPSPWFKEWYTKTDQNYSPYEPVLLWSMANNGNGSGFCSTPDYDITNNCKICFDLIQPIWFYKARIFNLPKFSY